jgi:hypothetical protein
MWVKRYESVSQMTFERAEKFRVKTGMFASNEGDQFGNFLVRVNPLALPMQVLAAPISDAWQHVSVSLSNRCPTWPEMCFIKELFWEDDECVLQYHPSKEEYVNNHPYCLHLWRATHVKIPEPPNFLVGIK